MAHMKKSNLKIFRKVLESAAWLPPCSISEEVDEQYDSLVMSIDDLITSIYRKFVDSIGEDVVRRLDVPLLCKSATIPGLLECNIDR